LLAPNWARGEVGRGVCHAQSLGILCQLHSDGQPAIVLCNELVEGPMPRFDKRRPELVEGLSAQEFPLLDLGSRW
jgi:hypothetical protein